MNALLFVAALSGLTAVTDYNVYAMNDGPFGKYILAQHPFQSENRKFVVAVEMTCPKDTLVIEYKLFKNTPEQPGIAFPAQVRTVAWPPNEQGGGGGVIVVRETAADVAITGGAITSDTRIELTHPNVAEERFPLTEQTVYSEGQLIEHQTFELRGQQRFVRFHLQQDTATVELNFNAPNLKQFVAACSVPH